MLASTQTRAPKSVEDLISPGLAAALDHLDVHTQRRFAGRLQGERRSKARGRSVEFEDYRQYVAGDDLRHIDWNVFARLDRFFIKVFQEEQDLAVHIVVDASASMDAGTPNKLILAQRIAMALGHLALASQNRLCVWIFSTGSTGTLRGITPMRGRTNVPRLAHFLLENTFAPRGAQPSATSTSHPDEHTPGAQLRTPDFTAACRHIAATRTGRGVLILLSDMLAPTGASYLPGLNALAGHDAHTANNPGGGGGWDTTTLQILSPGELDPATELDGSGNRLVIGDLRLTDAETGRAAEVTVTTDLLERYRKNLERYQQTLTTACAARGISHMLIRSDADVSTLLLTDLRRRGLLR